MPRCPPNPSGARPAAAAPAERNRTYRRNVMTMIVVGVMLAPLAIASLWVLSNVESSTAGNADVVVEIQQGWTPAQVGDTLEQRGVIASSAAFQEVAASVAVHRRTSPGATTSSRTATRARRSTRCAAAPRRNDPRHRAPAPARADAATDRRPRRQARGQERGALPRRPRSPTPSARAYEPNDVTSLEGLTWPDTYLIGANETEAQILQKIVDQFDAKADEIGLGTSGAANGGLSPYQALVSASLIEAEAGTKDDTPLISAVIVNRLKEDMPLQIDATLCYAKGGCPPVPTDADRKIDSPYNTYKVKGLPPTPIKTVSEVALARRAAIPRRCRSSTTCRTRTGRPTTRSRCRSTRRTWPRRVMPADDAASPASAALRERGRVGDRAPRRPDPQGHRRARTSRTSSRSRRWSCTTAARESEAIAGLLHDAIEDAGVKPKQIRRRYGRKVSRIVKACTETIDGKLPDAVEGTA